jgi:hypothetical protein
MALTDELLDLDRRLATGDGDTYRELLDAEATVVIPGDVLDRAATVAAMDASPGWDTVELTDASAVALGSDAALVTYTFTARRADQEYRALLSSAYVRREGGWRMAFHQQTPLAGVSADP